MNLLCVLIKKKEVDAYMKVYLKERNSGTYWSLEAIETHHEVRSMELQGSRFLGFHGSICQGDLVVGN